MKQMFQSLSELAARLQADARSKQDFLAPAAQISMDPLAALSMGGAAAMKLSDLGHDQLADYTNIPRAYYDRLREGSKDLLAVNVNHWLHNKGSERRMVRTRDGVVRALLSDRYQRIDNHEVAEVALDALRSVPGFRIVSCAVTEQRLYIKAVSEAVQQNVTGSRRVGDVVEAGVLVSNSEVGLGSVSIQPFAHFLVCTNGMVRSKEGLRAAHVGRRMDTALDGLLSEGTKRLEDEVVLRKVQDVIRHAFDKLAFRRFIDQLEASVQQPIAGDVTATVEALGPTLGLTSGERQSVLRHLIEGGDLSRYGLMNAVTRSAHDVPSYDRATELEAAGFRVVELQPGDWEAISQVRPVALAAE
jgi:hypothetical protein